MRGHLCPAVSAAGPVILGVEMGQSVDRMGLLVDQQLVDFIENEALPDSGVAADRFWGGLAGMVTQFADQNRRLLATRDSLQVRIDDWHKTHGAIAGQEIEYQEFLRQIGYLVDEPDDFEIEPGPMDPEISTICGPQLVVPVSNARYALNAANARWGSLYDAFYGTDVISSDGDLAPGAKYNPTRGAAVFLEVSKFLDEHFPLATGSHGHVMGYRVEDQRLLCKTRDGEVGLKEPGQFVGYRNEEKRDVFVLRHHGLHVELVSDPSHPVGATHPASLADVVLESALTTIQDCEDSVAAVDAEDKVGVYRNWLGLMTGTLKDTFEKGGKTITRELAPDRRYSSPRGAGFALKGRSLLLVRNVGHLMTTPMVKDAQGREVGEGLVDAAVTVLCALHDLNKSAGMRNSTAGRVYVVKPKMHGPEEVRFACDIFGAVEEFLGLEPNTIKIGIMDEERRTSANLKACIHAARFRLFFINTGFLDRTGDEIHTSMWAGPVPPKAEIKSADWITAYEDRNVMIGLGCGLSGVAQIGKGMWAMPEEMKAMLESKGGQPNQGANCAWVPSPTAATLHAIHYHQVDVFAAQKRRHNEETPGLDRLFSMPVANTSELAADAIAKELENNAQGILGYVVRWIDQGVGCSKVPDIHDVGLMEDRATLRISSQHISNWLAHGVISRAQVDETFQRMAAVVDKQNEGDPLYQPMAGHFETSIAYKAAVELAVEGVSQPSGYTEPILHRRRAEHKAAR